MHLVVAIPPKIAVSKFIGQVKGVASTRFNKLCLSTTPFFWQEEYDVFSFDRKRLPNWAAYAERQKEHHAQGTTILACDARRAMNSPGYRMAPREQGQAAHYQAGFIWRCPVAGARLP